MGVSHLQETKGVHEPREKVQDTMVTVRLGGEKGIIRRVQIRGHFLGADTNPADREAFGRESRKRRKEKSQKRKNK